MFDTCFTNTKIFGNYLWWSTGKIFKCLCKSALHTLLDWMIQADKMLGPHEPARLLRVSVWKCSSGLHMLLLGTDS